MKTCKGCKYLTEHDFACRADEQLERLEDPLTGRVYYRDPRFPNNVFRPTPAEMRAPDGRCGEERKLYAPSLWARIFPWAFED